MAEGGEKKGGGGGGRWGVACAILLMSRCAINNNEQWETAVNGRRAGWRTGGPSAGVRRGHANEQQQQQPDIPLTGAPLLRTC